jgi:hypothetical protein
MCPVCEQASNRIYYSQISYATRLVGEYRLRQQMQVQAEVDAALEDMGLHGPTERRDDPAYDREVLV